MVRMIQGHVDIFASVGVLIADVQRLKQEFVEVKVSFVWRSGNSLAHVVAKNSVKGSGVRSWETHPPPACSPSS